jgi:S-adenosylmethionine:tRNA ribosyltransferase-isomerase
MLRKSDFHYELPPELIAQYPAARRSASRLLHVARDGLHDRMIADLPQLLRPHDLLVFNDTRVIPARLHGQKETGGRVELLVERVLDEREFLAQLGVSKTPKPGGRIRVGGTWLTVMAREEDLFRLRLEGEATVMEFLHVAGELPLPPYVEHRPDAADAERYQTVFARAEGAVAAPTAGLHFDADLLAAIDAAGIGRATLTLHVGAGTFQPVRVEDLSQHRMHAERFEISAELCAAIARARAAGGRIVAVGTTVTRALEAAAAQPGGLRPMRDETRLFITPGYRFQVIDLLLTNFHLPGSTLLMLVSAFGGYETMLRSYQHAVAGRYRFFSYGDAMLIEAGCAAGQDRTVTNSPGFL